MISVYDANDDDLTYIWIMWCIRKLELYFVWEFYGIECGYEWILLRASMVLMNMSTKTMLN